MRKCISPQTLLMQRQVALLFFLFIAWASFPALKKLKAIPASAAHTPAYILADATCASINPTGS